MKRRRIFVFVILVLLGLTACTKATDTSQFSNSPLKVVKDVPMPGEAVRFDYQDIDPITGKLYISHMNDDHLIVFDSQSDTVLANISGYAGVRGIRNVPSLNKVFASTAGSSQVNVLDTETLTTKVAIDGVDSGDGIAYAPISNRVFVSEEGANADAVIDAATNKLLKVIPLGNSVGNTAFDAKNNRILVAVHGVNELVSIDPTGLMITGRYPMTGISDPHGIYIDEENQLAFVAGEGNAQLALVDLSTMKVLGTYKTGGSPDVLAFDKGLHEIYVASESGLVYIYKENKQKLTEIGHFSMPNAHTVAVDSKTHKVYFPLENVNGRPVLRIMKPTSID